MLSAVGGKEKQLRDRRDGLFRVKNRFAQTTPEGRIAGFEGCNKIDAAGAQRPGKHTQLRGFAAAVNPFKSYKFSAQSWLMQKRSRPSVPAKWSRSSV